MLHLLQKALPKPAAGWLFAASVWSILMVLAPIMVRFAERNNHEVMARLVAVAGYCWMGWIFVFCSVAALLKCCQGIYWLLQRLLQLPNFVLLQPRPLFIICVLFASTIFILGRFEALNVRIEKQTITTDKLPANSSLRIALISDLHVGLLLTGENFVQKIAAILNKAKPDLIVCTGDLVDSNLQNSHAIAAILRQLAPPLGKVAVPGNHEYYAGFGKAKEFTKQSGFTMLRSGAAAFGDNLWIIGVDDPAGKQTTGYDADAEQRLLAAAPQDRFVLLLKHRPDVDRTNPNKFDLQLSGHVHKGQIFPFGLLTRLQYQLPTGLTALKNQGWLYTSRGTGTWGPPIRFLAPPEITLLDLVSSHPETPDE